MNSDLLEIIILSLQVSGTALVFSTLLGVPIGVWMGLSRFVGRKVVVTLLYTGMGFPPVVIGLFVYEVYVIQVRHFSGWGGALALSILVIPIVIRTTENMLRLVPNTLREAAAALGAPQWKIINFVTLRAARAGIITGVLLAVARIAGETAPLLFTALNNQFQNTDMNKPMANLPSAIFQYAMSPYDDWHSLAWAGALLITFSVLTLNILARVLFRQKATSH